MNNLLASTGSIVVDVVAVVVILGCALMDLKRGFVKTFLSLFGTILSLLLAVLLASKVAVFLQDRFGLVSSISQGLKGPLISIFGQDAMNIPIGLVDENALATNGVAGWIAQIIMASKADGTISLDTTVGDVLAPTFAHYVAMAIAIVALFIVFKLIFFVIGKIIRNLHSIKPIAIVDKSLGFLLGIISAVVSLEIVATIISLIPIGFVQTLNGYIKESYILGFIQNLNIFSIILQNISYTDILVSIKSVIGA